MPSKKTRKQRIHRRRTLRRKRRGGAEIINANPNSQHITIPTAAFKVSAPVNSTDIMGGISKL